MRPRDSTWAPRTEIGLSPLFGASLTGVTEEADALTKKIIPDSPLPTAADGVTLASYALGLWWGFGGPNAAGIASILGDEIDGRIARATKTTRETGSHLDWGQDVALTPLALWRLGKALGVPVFMVATAPVVLYFQAYLRGMGWRPAVGSARAGIMVAAMVVEALKGP